MGGFDVDFLPAPGEPFAVQEGCAGLDAFASVSVEMIVRGTM